jgi:hypothetical protein
MFLAWLISVSLACHTALEVSQKSNKAATFFYQVKINQLLGPLECLVFSLERDLEWQS